MINNNKIIATAVLAVVMTVTALALASPQPSWDGALLTDSGYDSSAATTAAIPNVSDVWSAFDAVSDIMSFEWLIPSAFAAPTVVSINGYAPDQNNYVYINITEGIVTTLTVVGAGNGTLSYEWFWDSAGEPSNIQGKLTDTITFTAPMVSKDTYFNLAAYVEEDNTSDRENAFIDLLVLNVVNTTPPVIILNGSATIQIPINGTYNEQGAVCDDDVDADKPATVGGATVDPATLGPYIITYDCADMAGNNATQVIREVTVVATADTTPPMIELNGPDPVEVVINGAYNEQNARCTDNVDPEKIAEVNNTAVDTSVANTYTVYYDCTDDAGNVATQVTRDVVVAADTTPPSITLNGPDPVEVVINGAYNEQNARCIDNVDPEKIAEVNNTAVDTSVANTYTVYYDCTDDAGNAATQVTRDVVVASDTTPPSITP